MIIHTNIDKIIHTDQDGYKKDLININIELDENGLDYIHTIPLDSSDYIDIDTFDDLYLIETVPEDETEKQDWYDENYYRIYSELENLNTKIEEYLKSIDIKYGTSYCPTGSGCLESFNILYKRKNPSLYLYQRRVFISMFLFIIGL